MVAGARRTEGFAMTGGDVWSARMLMVDAVIAPFKVATLGQVFDRVVEEFPHHPAFIFEDRQCSYLKFARLETAAIPVTSVNPESPPCSPWRRVHRSAGEATVGRY